MPKINKTKYAVLGMLSYKSMSGYEMKKLVDNSIAHFWNENYGHIYPVLKRLEEDGLVTKKTEHAEGKPSRHVYSLTGRGKKDLHEWLLLPPERPILRIELLLKLFFGQEVSTDTMIRHVEQEMAFCKGTLSLFDQIEKRMDSPKPKSKRVPYGLITLRYGQYYYRAILDWCKDTQNILSSTQGGVK
jgi:DNA-binding PadR family transcriptional regulator